MRIRAAFLPLRAALFVWAAVSFSAGVRAASPVATYQFQGNFNPNEAGAPALAPTDPLGTSKFNADTVLGQVRSVWTFAGAASPVTQQAGLAVDTTGLIEPRSYSIDFVAKLTQRAGGYRRLVDVQNRQSDNGFYVNPNNNLEVYPTGGTTAAWSNDVYHHVVLTNDGERVLVFLDGVSQFTSVTTLLNLDLDPAANPQRLLTFFLDNVAGGGQGEWSGGSVALVRLWDGVLTPDEAQAVASNPFAVPAPTVTITSPPAGIPLVSGQTVTAAVSAPDPNRLLKDVQFYLDDALLADVPAPGPYMVDFTVPSAGDHTLRAVGITTDGRQDANASVITSVDADPAQPAPSAEVLTDANGRALAAGTTVTISAQALSNTEGEDLDRVDFYADGAIFASLDGGGNPVDPPTSPATNPALPTRRDVASGPSSSVFTAQYQMPGANKLVSLLTVALTKTGKAQASKPVMVQSVANVADRPPTVSINRANLAPRIKASTRSIEVAVDVADPDAGGNNAVRGPRPVTRVFESSGAIARMEYYLNSLKVKDSAEAPYKYAFSAPAGGSYALTVIATDGSGLATISDPVRFEASAPPAVRLSVKGSPALVEGGEKGKVQFTRDGDTDEDLTVYFKAAGSAKNGVDYAKLPEAITIPAGFSSAKLKLKPVDDGASKGTRKITIKLAPSPEGEYQSSAGAKAKFTLSDRE